MFHSSELLLGDSTDSILLKYSRQVSLGLDYLVDKGIAHGALKASNVLVSREKTCKVSETPHQ